MSEHLLLKFRAKDSPYGITRDTLKVLAAALGMPETTIIHLAVSRFAQDVLPQYESDDGPPSAQDLAWLRKTAKEKLPKGKVVSRHSLR